MEQAQLRVAMPEAVDMSICKGWRAGFFGAALVLTVLGISLIELGENSPHPSADPGAIYIIGITSAWIPMPGMIAMCTPRWMLSRLGPRARFFRLISYSLCVPSCLVSFAAWYHWSNFLGQSDQSIATAMLAALLLLGLSREGFPAWSSAFLSCLTVVIVIAEQSLESYKPWPHVMFRLTGIIMGQSSMNSGLVISSPMRFLQVTLLFVPIYLGHAAIEACYSGCPVGSCSQAAFLQTYWFGVARTYVALLTFLALVSKLLGAPQRIREQEEEEESFRYVAAMCDADHK